MTDDRIGPACRLALIGAPFLWLALFFLVPLLIVVKISLAHSVVGIPPYTPLSGAAMVGLKFHDLGEFPIARTRRSLLRAYLGSLANAAGDGAMSSRRLSDRPYDCTRSRGSPILLFLVVLPFWTSFLIRVYAWIAILSRPAW